MLAREHLEPPHTGILPRQQLRDPEQLPAVLAALLAAVRFRG
jgi:hypothetical protein